MRGEANWTAADEGLRRAREELDGGNRLKAFDANNRANPEHDATLVELVRALRKHGGDTRVGEARAALDRWLALRGKDAHQSLPDDVVAFARPELRPPKGAQATASPGEGAAEPVAVPPLRPQTIDQYEILRPLHVSASQHLYVASYRRDATVEPAVARWLPGVDPRAAEAWFALHRDLVRPLLECRTTRRTAEGHTVAFYDAPAGRPLSALDDEAKGGPTRRERTRIIAALATAVRRLHHAGAHHGDLRPDLVLANRNDSGDWAIHLLPGWYSTDEGTRIAVPERESWFEGAPQDGPHADLFALARIARELIGERATPGSPLGVYLRELEALARKGKLDATLAFGTAERTGLFQELVAADDWNDVQRLSDWSYRRVLGIGATGVVFEAQHQHRGIAAIKFLRNAAATPALVAMFKQRHLVDLRHENLVHVLDVTPVEHGAPYYEIMESLPGQPLPEGLAAAEPFRDADAFAWMRDLCRGCSVLHMRGFAHLDVKPGNVFLAVRDDGRRRAMLLDHRTGGSLHGESKPVARAAQSRYVAPEVAANPPRVSDAADVFSSGRVFEDLLDHTELPAHRVAALRELIRAMTSADPQARPDLSVVYFELERIEKLAASEAEPLPAEAPGPPRPWPWIAAFAVALVLAALFTILWMLEGRRTGRALGTLRDERSAHQQTRSDRDQLLVDKHALTGERDSAAQARDQAATDANTLRADVLRFDGELVKARANEAEVTACLALKVADYTVERGARCGGLGDSIKRSMDELRAARLLQLRTELHAAPNGSARQLARAKDIRKLDLVDLRALEALLGGRGALCADARDAADEVIDRTPVASLAEAAWEARLSCNRGTDAEDRALTKLAEISHSTKRVIELLKERPNDGVQAVQKRTQDPKALCEYVNEAILTLPHASATERINSLRSIQQQRDCKGNAPITLTADARASLTFFDPGATVPRDEKKQSTFELNAPGNYEIQARWSWADAPSTVSARIPLVVGLQEKKQIHLRRVEVRSVAPATGVTPMALQSIEIKENYGRSQIKCENSVACGLGVVFIGDVTQVTLTVVPPAGHYVDLPRCTGALPQNCCTETPQGCEIEVKSASDAQRSTVVEVAVREPPRLTVTADNDGSITVTPACATYPCVLTPGTTYTLVASPADRFLRWSNCPGATGAICTLTPRAGSKHDVVARFEAEELPPIDAGTP